MFVDWRPVHHGVAGSAEPRGVSAAAVAEAGDMPNENLVRAEGCLFGHRVGASVTHLPLVVRTRSPSTFGSVVAVSDSGD